MKKKKKRNIQIERRRSKKAADNRNVLPCFSGFMLRFSGFTVLQCFSYVFVEHEREKNNDDNDNEKEKEEGKKVTDSQAQRKTLKSGYNKKW